VLGVWLGPRIGLELRIIEGVGLGLSLWLWLR
jgi:hypothetical protein